MLQLVADRLRGCVREIDTVARLGGDEFAIVLVDCPEPRTVADRVVSCMDQETTILGRAVYPSISVGLAQHRATSHPSAVTRLEGNFSPVQRRDRSRSTNGVNLTATAAVEAAAEREAAAGRLLRAADTAMYAAKAAGKGHAAILEPDPAATPVLFLETLTVRYGPRVSVLGQQR